MNGLVGFLIAVSATLAAVVALFFLRFWRDTGDRFFAVFAAAFAVLSGHWVALAATSRSSESRPLIYLLRLLAFVLILAAIVDKNRKSR